MVKESQLSYYLQKRLDKARYGLKLARLDIKDAETSANLHLNEILNVKRSAYEQGIKLE